MPLSSSAHVMTKTIVFAICTVVKTEEKNTFGHIDNLPKMVLYVATHCTVKLLVSVATDTFTHNMWPYNIATFTHTHIQNESCHT